MESLRLGTLGVFAFAVFMWCGRILADQGITIPKFMLGLSGTLLDLVGLDDAARLAFQLYLLQ